jgi:hypothetical protein
MFIYILFNYRPTSIHWLRCLSSSSLRHFTGTTTAAARAAAHHQLRNNNKAAPATAAAHQFRHSKAAPAPAAQYRLPFHISNNNNKRNSSSNKRISKWKEMDKKSKCWNRLALIDQL